MKHVVRSPRGQHGFTLVEILIAIALIGMALALMVSNINWSDRSVANLKNQVLSDATSIETAFSNYYNDKNTYPTSLADGNFTPAYIYAPNTPEGFDETYGIQLKSVSGTSPYKGHVVALKIVAPQTTGETAWRAAVALRDSLPAKKFEICSADPCTSGTVSTALADAAPATDMYVHYWLRRQ